jgi:hypothetical protein
MEDLRKGWAKACRKAKVPSLLFHGVRCSAICNTNEAGVSESVAMKISNDMTNKSYRLRPIAATQSWTSGCPIEEACVP